MRQIKTFFATALLATSLVTQAMAQEAPSLVEYLSSTESSADLLSSDQNAALDTIRNDPAASAIQLGRTTAGLVPEASALSLVLPKSEPSEADAVVSFDDLVIEQRGDQNFSLSSPTDASGAELSLVVMGQDVIGTIKRDGEVYKVHPLGGGLTAVYRYDTTSLEDHPENYQEFLEEQGGLDVLPDDAAPAPDVADTGAVIDVLVAYTAQARTEAGNINALIQLAFDESNRIYANSRIRPRLRLVHSYQTGYTQHSNMGTDLGRLRSTNDGHADEAHRRRDQYRADMVVLLVGRSNYCGVGYLNADAANAFSVVAQNCATGYYSFAHELAAAGTNTAFPYGHGFCNDLGNWRTVMSYNSGGRCPSRLQYFSNPNVSHNGTPTGDATVRNNARVINETAFRVANFRQALPPSGACRAGFREAGSRMCITTNTANASTFANALVYCKDRLSRVASYGDLRYLYVRTSFDAAYNPSGRWIGNYVGDDRALCGNRSVTSNNDSDIANFEGTCSRFDNRSFWCTYDR